MEALGVNDMEAAIHDVERTYVLIEEGDVLVPGKCVMRWGTTPEDENVYGRINAMPGYVGGEYGLAGIKWIGSGPMNYKKGLPRASVTVILNDPDTKLPVCIADGTQVSAKRTGASGGVAMKLLSRKDADTMLICGAGAQGRTQLEAAMIVRPIKTVYVYDIRFEGSQKFADEAMAVSRLDGYSRGEPRTGRSRERYHYLCYFGQRADHPLRLAQEGLPADEYG